MQESSRDSKTISSTRGGTIPDVGNALLSFSVRWWWASDVYIGPADCYRGHREGNGLLTELNVKQCLLILIFIIPLSMGWRSCQTFQNIRLQWWSKYQALFWIYDWDKLSTPVAVLGTGPTWSTAWDTRWNIVVPFWNIVVPLWDTVETLCNIVKDWDQRGG